MFYVSLLKPCNKTNDDNSPMLLSIIVEKEDKYKVEKIFDSRIFYRQLQLFVK